jgi:ABC-type branched-subunit amino acid transport system ATPase component
MSLLRTSSISLSIGEHRILTDVSLSLDEGEIVGLIGPNGSGKTTLFNVISGFLAPTRGSIHFRGTDITRASPSKRAQLGIGRVFQNFGIFREMTLQENVLVALEALPKKERALRGDLKKLSMETIELVGLQSHAKAKAGSLSGGQMRLLEIARTLMSGKEVFLLDEPTAGVSPKMTQQVADLILQLKTQGKTVIIIEHDLPFIARICDRVVVMDVGAIVLAGRPDEVKRSKELRELYFGADPTT